MYWSLTRWWSVSCRVIYSLLAYDWNDNNIVDLYKNVLQWATSSICYWAHTIHPLIQKEQCGTIHLHLIHLFTTLRSQTASTTQCLTITIFDDQIYEGTENFTGQLVGVLTDSVVVPNIPRLTIQPRQTTIQVTDDDGNVSLKLHYP